MPTKNNVELFKGPSALLLDMESPLIPKTGDPYWRISPDVPKEPSAWEKFKADPIGVLGDHIKANMNARMEKAKRDMEALRNGKMPELTEEDLASALDSISGGAVGAIRGMKRLPWYTHGTESLANKASIEKVGFTRGGSSELELEGTSLSRDPLVALNPQFANYDPEKVLVVKPNIDPKDIRNLRPSEYIQGRSYLGDSLEVYNKPNEFFNEAETFMRRDPLQLPDASVRDLTPEEVLNVSADIKALEQFKSKRDSVLSPFLTDRPPLESKDMRELLGGLRNLQGNRGTWNNQADRLLQSLEDYKVQSTTKAPFIFGFKKLDEKVSSYVLKKRALDFVYQDLTGRLKDGVKVEEEALRYFDELTKEVQKLRRDTIDSLEQTYGYKQKPVDRNITKYRKEVRAEDRSKREFKSLPLDYPSNVSASEPNYDFLGETVPEL